MLNKNRLNIPVLMETDNDIVVVKPAGMASQLTSDPNNTSLISKIKKACSDNLQPELPHRLDRITRGLMLVSLTKEATVFHNENIRNNRWFKYYLARVSCRNDLDLQKLIGIHKAYLRQKGNKAEIVRSGGKPSFLDILQISPAPGKKNQYHIFLKLLTGRFHQIRAMFANLGFPLTDDFLYNNKKKGKKGLKKEDFYLEAIILKFIDFNSKKTKTVYYEEDPDREKITEEMKKAIREVYRGEK